MTFTPPDPRSVLLITLDSCRYDTFASARVPNISRVGPLYKAQAPACFTYASHAAMFVGFTPSVPGHAQPYVNTQAAKVFRMARGGESGQPDYVELQGRNIIDGFRRVGFATIGTGAMGWFNPERETSRPLMQDFEQFWYAGNGRSLRKQLEFVGTSLGNVGAAPRRGWFGRERRAGEKQNRPVFVFINVGETHIPYWHEGADWDRKFNPCLPVAATNDAAECRRRQIACLEFADAQLGPLLEAFLSSAATVMVCGDHGDCWGEDGVWGHGFSHPKVHEVPLLMHLSATNPLQ